MIMGFLVFGLLLWLACGLIGALVGADKGLTGFGFLAGFVLGPIGVLVVAVMQPRPQPAGSTTLAPGMRTCPACAESVRAEATICRYCQRDLPPLRPAAGPR
jgi:hypothetical protein